MRNQDPLDLWTLVHAGVGLGAGLMGVGFIPATLAAAGYEIFEQAFERSEWGQETFETSGPESAENVACDMLAFWAGWYIGKENR